MDEEARYRQIFDERLSYLMNRVTAALTLRFDGRARVTVVVTDYVGERPLLAVCTGQESGPGQAQAHLEEALTLLCGGEGELLDATEESS